MRMSSFLLCFCTLSGKQKENSHSTHWYSLLQQTKAISNSEIGKIWQILRLFFKKWWKLSFLFKNNETGYNWNLTPDMSLKRLVLEIEWGPLPWHITGKKKWNVSQNLNFSLPGLILLFNSTVHCQPNGPNFGIFSRKILWFNTHSMHDAQFYLCQNSQKGKEKGGLPRRWKN